MNKVAKLSSVRIIAGKWRGRRVGFPNREEIRPTHDRIRETLFNWLTPYIYNTNCLDGFAGSGVLGLEALSRGAAQTTFIDHQRENIETIKKNSEQLDASAQTRLIQRDFFKITHLAQAPFDIIFLDPPYFQSLIEKACEHIEKNGWIKEGTLIYIEKGKKEQLNLSEQWKCLKQGKTKRIDYQLYTFRKFTL